MTKHERWLREGKKVWVIVDSVSGIAEPVITLSYGEDSKDAIIGTMLENQSGITVENRTVTEFNGEIPSGKFLGWVK